MGLTAQTIESLDSRKQKLDVIRDGKQYRTKTKLRERGNPLATQNPMPASILYYHYE